MFEYLSNDHGQSKYYYHGCRNMETLSKILDSKKICTPRELGLKLEKGKALFNGLDHVGVCKKFSDSEYCAQDINGRISAFPDYICKNHGLILSDDIKAKKTEIYNIRNYSPDFIYKFVSEHADSRWSDMFDEFQVKGSIGIDKFKAVIIPVDELEFWWNRPCPNDIQFLLNIISKADEYNLDIVNSCDDKFSELYESSDYNRDEQNNKIKKRVMKIIRQN